MLETIMTAKVYTAYGIKDIFYRIYGGGGRYLTAHRTSFLIK